MWCSQELLSGLVFVASFASSHIITTLKIFDVILEGFSASFRSIGYCVEVANKMSNISRHSWSMYVLLKANSLWLAYGYFASCLHNCHSFQFLPTSLPASVAQWLNSRPPHGRPGFVSRPMYHVRKKDSLCHCLQVLQDYSWLNRLLLGLVSCMQ